MDNLLIQKFSEINLNDKFFDSLKAGYAEFSEWFQKKADDHALVLYSNERTIEGFLYCKFESGPGDDTNPLLPDTDHMKVGTFKFNPKGTRRGDRYLKKIFDYALAHQSKPSDIYVTVFENEHGYLVELFERYGFERYGTKTGQNGTELVLLRDLNKQFGDINKDYPFIYTEGCKKYLLSVYPKYHTVLFPDSKLLTESPNIVQDISHSNSIHKIYICGMDGVTAMKPGDVLVIYRTGDGQGAAEFRAVATSLCIVEDVHTISDYESEEHFVSECVKYSVFTEKELRGFYRSQKYPYVIKFTYNAALPKRPIRRKIADEAGVSRDDYWGVLELSDQQFQQIVNISEVRPELIRN
ncbi:N-acetyltransferase [Vibrio sinaloensis]|uniref:N-acetyltransferase n=1 Tax=Photobacterium sp. (strain ATCC 43367) TaxID=379097 RepID=UPI00206F0B4D|nr:N-acetyltransferase [Vibrio sinaloensis]UPQ89741.1 N-acetyltransferase [Vibrio sinaloensis]